MDALATSVASATPLMASDRTVQDTHEWEQTEPASSVQYGIPFRLIMNAVCRLFIDICLNPPQDGHPLNAPD